MSLPHAPAEPELHVLRWSAPSAATELVVRQQLERRAAAGRFPWPVLGTGPVRTALVAADAGAARSALRQGEVLQRRGRGGQPRPVALMFPGQGAQQPRMAAGLYRACPVFTDAIDEVLGCFGADGPRLRAAWLATGPAADIHASRRAQPLLFAVSYALGRMVLSWGLRPVALLGHSVGEIAAATLAAVFDVTEAAKLVKERVAAAAKAPPGGMLAVAASMAEILPLLGDHVAIAAVNAPRQTVLAGLTGPLAAARERLRAAGFICRPLQCDVAYHSPAATELATGALPALTRMALRPPALPVYSGYTARRLTAETAGDPGFWARHATRPVLFWPALDTLLSDADVLLIDASAGQSLTAAARRHPYIASGRSDVLGLLPARPGPGLEDRRTTLAAAARIWAEGHDISMPLLAGDGGGRAPQPASPGSPTAPVRIAASWPRGVPAEV